MTTRKMFLGLVALGLASVFSGCSNAPGAVGEACAGESDCDTDLSCFNRPGAAESPVCMADCDPATTPICTDGSVCLERVGGGAGVCYLGGTEANGASCTGATNCSQGSICVNAGGMTQCATACVPGDGSRCASTEMCSSLSSGGGFCEAMP